MKKIKRAKTKKVRKTKSKPKLKRETLNQKMSLEKAIQKYPRVKDVLTKKGLLCEACGIKLSDSIEKSAYKHGIDIDFLMDELFKSIKKEKA